MTKSSTRTRKTTAKTPAKASATTAPVEEAVTSTAPSEASKPATAEATALKKRELFERVKARSTGVKGKDVRVVMDAMLEELGAMLVEGKGLNARPLGTLKVQKHNVQPGADVVVCKLRRKKPGAAKKEPLAAAGE